MKWLVYILLVAEAVLVACALLRTPGGNVVVLLLAGNSVLLIWSATRWRRKPSCCR
jgi:hypothetical protein